MKIIPKPLSVSEHGGVFEFSASTGISKDVCGVDFFNGFLNRTYGYVLPEGDSICAEMKDVGLGDEGYLLEISENGIIISAKNERGVFYGIQSLIQLVFEYADAAGTAKIPCMTIKDKPRFGYRSFMFDCCRHFFGVEVVKQLLDVCALHKLNVFHWHLTEDQGWRIEIDKYPKLTEIGSMRSETRGDKTPHGGYFTKNDIKEIVRYAADRFIEVIPEIDLPGHMRAAIAAYPELGCKNEQTEVATHFGIHTEILCGGRESTYTFIYDVLDELAELFPSKYVHLGGDEAPKIVWRKCSDCLQKVKDEGLASIEQLQGYLTNKAVNHLKSLGKIAICWNESLHSGMLDESATVQYWMGPKGGAEVIEAANKGRKIVISKFKPYYLDYPYGMTRLSATYKFEPVLKGINADGEKNILGVEAPLWTEYVAELKDIEYQAFPRLTAVAETAWTAAENKNYKCFLLRLQSVKGLLKRYGFNVVSEKESNPNPVKGTLKLMKFAKRLADPDAMARQKAVAKDKREMLKEQKEVLKK